MRGTQTDAKENLIMKHRTHSVSKRHTVMKAKFSPQPMRCQVSWALPNLYQHLPGRPDPLYPSHLLCLLLCQEYSSQISPRICAWCVPSLSSDRSSHQLNRQAFWDLPMKWQPHPSLMWHLGSPPCPCYLPQPASLFFVALVITGHHIILFICFPSPAIEM